MRGLQIALTFLTRLPLPTPQNVTQEEFTASQKYYPQVGLILGLILWGLGRAVMNFYPPSVVGALLLLAEIILSGGIHLDGFMDSMDGLLSARGRERMLEIMKDSRVGAHASISLVCLLITKYAILSNLSSSSLIILILLPLLSRWSFLISILAFPYARSEGLGKGFHETSSLLAFTFQGLLIFLFAYWLIGIPGLITTLVTLLFVTAFSWLISKVLGGLTGDVYGAVIELTEVVILLVAFPLLT